MVNILFLIAFLATVSSFMFIDTGLGDALGLAAQGCLGVLFVLACLKLIASRWLKLPGLLKLWLGMIVLVFLLALGFPSFAQKAAFGDVRELFIPFAVAFSAYVLFDLKDKTLGMWLIVLGVVCLFTIFYILKHSGGFVLADQYRATVYKNQTSPFYAQMSILCIAMAMWEKNWLKIAAYLVIFAGCFAYCLFVQTRTSCLGIFLITLVLFFMRFRIKAVIVVPVVLAAVLVVFGEGIFDFIGKSLVANRDVTALDDITSGRAALNAKFFSFAMSHFWTGGLEGGADCAMIWKDNGSLPPHLFLLWKWAKYGAIFSLPYIIMYVSVGWTAFKMMVRYWDLAYLGVICVGLAYFSSFAEYAAPFGPGTSYLICYIMFGRALSRVRWASRVAYRLLKPALSHVEKLS